MSVRSLKMLSLVALAAVCIGCGSEDKPSETINAGALELHEDGVMNFAVKVPADWELRTKPGELAVAFSSPGVIQRFSTFEAQGTVGAKIGVSVEALGESTLDEYINNSYEFGDPKVYSSPTAVTIDGAPGKMYSYEFALNDGTFKGERYFATPQDSARAGYVTVLDVAAFGNNFANLKPTFDEAVKSLKLAHHVERAPRVDTIFQGGEEFIPSETLRIMNGNGYSISMPENFRGKPEKSASAISGTKFIGSATDGAPSDCFIQVEVFDASKGKDLDKIAEENRAAYKAGAASKTKVGGLDARAITDTRMSQVSGKVYFVVKGNKMFRIGVYYYIPEQDKYAAIFQKALETITFK